MKLLILSDIHANEAALAAVLKRVRRHRYSLVVCLGDVVGYGAEPNQVLDRLRKLRARRVFVRGNHDRVIAGLDDGASFNEVARRSAFWTRDHLSRVNRNFVRSFRPGPFALDSEVTVCHGSPEDEDQYLVTLPDAERMLRRPDSTWVALFGHTHLPTVFELDDTGSVSGSIFRSESTVKLSRTSRYLINPGSVGQPRDRNPQAAFAVLDTEAATVRFFRVDYDREKTKRAILSAGLPPVLAHRLDHGS